MMEDIIIDDLSVAYPSEQGAYSSASQCKFQISFR